MNDKSTKDRLWNGLSVIAVVCAVVITTLVIRREFAPPVVPMAGRITKVDNWQQLVRFGHRIGPRDAKLVIVEFADFECPACALFTTNVLRPFLAANASDVAVIYRHFPLSYHDHAVSAAVASDCAALQNTFAAFHYHLYAQQDSIGVKPFARFASEAGVGDTLEFESCLRRLSAGGVESIARDTVDAHAVDFSGTPMVLVNGYRLPAPPTRQRLDSLLAEAL